jgi:heme exporter protein C
MTFKQKQYAPVERTMGNVQRIFYFHVGSAWVGSLAFLVALVGGVLFLRRPDKKWDTLALASVEIGLVFISMAIVSGSVWGKPAWNTWWLWSPRLTLVTIMWLAYAAYFMLRGAIDDEERRGRFAAVYVRVSFVTVILTFASIVYVFCVTFTPSSLVERWSQHKALSKACKSFPGWIRSRWSSR